MQAVRAPKQTNAANKRKFQRVVNYSSSDASASAVDSAVETRTNDLREPTTVESECDDEEEEEEEDELVGEKPKKQQSKDHQDQRYAHDPYIVFNSR